jgi:hypothetical protein
MPQVKDYTAKQELKLDCGHTIHAGDLFHVTSIFSCNREGNWPLRILMACFAVAGRKQPSATPAPAGKPQAEKQETKPPTSAKS